jgi:hypothetical protein
MKAQRGGKESEKMSELCYCWSILVAGYYLAPNYKGGFLGAGD